jgi:malate synthase
LSSIGIGIHGPLKDNYAKVLTPEALTFVAAVVERFEPTRKSLLRYILSTCNCPFVSLHRFLALTLLAFRERELRQKEISSGKLPDFLPETKHIREVVFHCKLVFDNRKADWKVAPIPADLLDRRVEITGPVSRKMLINALNSGAKVVTIFPTF